MKSSQNFIVTKEFIGGLLHGIKYAEITSVKFKEGFVCEHPIGGSPYKITSVVPYEGDLKCGCLSEGNKNVKN